MPKYRWKNKQRRNKDIWGRIEGQVRETLGQRLTNNRHQFQTDVISTAISEDLQNNLIGTTLPADTSHIQNIIMNTLDQCLLRDLVTSYDNVNATMSEDGDVQVSLNVHPTHSIDNIRLNMVMNCE